MPELTVVDGRVPSALQRLVEDHLASCRAKGLSSKTVRTRMATLCVTSSSPGVRVKRSPSHPS
jgi:hypothetical protein